MLLRMHEYSTLQSQLNYLIIILEWVWLLILKAAKVFGWFRGMDVFRRALLLLSPGVSMHGVLFCVSH